MKFKKGDRVLYRGLGFKIVGVVVKPHRIWVEGDPRGFYENAYVIEWDDRQHTFQEFELEELSVIERLAELADD